MIQRCTRYGLRPHVTDVFGAILTIGVILTTATVNGSEEGRSRDISGRVTLEDGTPMPGVLVRATPSWLTDHERGRHIGSGLPKDEAASVIADRMARKVDGERQARREAITDEGGFYRITGLEDRRYAMKAYADGYQFLLGRGASSWVHVPGSRLDLRGIPVVAARIRIRLPDGSAPLDPVWVIYTPSDGSRVQRRLWSADQATLYFPPGTGTLHTTAGLHDEYFTEKVPVVLSEDSSDPTTLNLQTRTCLIGRVVDPPGALNWEGEVYLAPWPEGADQPTPADLVATRETEGLGFQRPVLGARSRTFAFNDLAPGRYLLAYAVFAPPKSDGDLTVVKPITIMEGVNRTELEVDESRLDRHLDVRIEGPEGQAIHDAKVSLSSVRTANRFSYGTVPHKVSYVDAFTRRIWIWRPGGTSQPHPGAERPLQREETRPGVTYTVRVATDRFGTQNVQWNLDDPGPLVVDFSAPGRLIVTMDDYVGSRLENHVGLSSAPEIGGLHGDSNPYWYSRRPSLIRPDADGVAVIHGLAPGTHRLWLLVEGEPEKYASFKHVDVEVASGENRVRLTMPAVYSIEVAIPGLTLAGRDSSARYAFKPKNTSMRTMATSRWFSPQAGRIVIPRVLKGEYLLMRGSQHMDLVVDQDLKVEFEQSRR